MADAAATEVAPFRFFHAEVVRTERLSPSLVRVTFGGPGLAGFASGGRDQSLSVFLPHPGQSEPVMPTGEGWFEEYRALDPGVRAILRSYTVRAQRDADIAGGGVEVDIDFVLHAEPAGPAATWAAGAGPGDRLILLGPAVPENTGVRFQLPEGASEVLLAGDETALPAAAAILESLPDDVPVRAWLAVPEEADRLPLRAPSGAKLTWIAEGGQGGQDALVAAFREAVTPGGDAPYAWLAGEAGMVKALRRHLVNECGVDRRSVSFIGYWRRGASEDDLRADAESGSGSAA
ncbi:siderophore-interacting protein [Streptomyces sp. A7024]|uniref:Siderophore-interacting protein n=1 Tax=Streptomyces coryli TaxID=1128680 RepID=A0A6G4U4T5_9ACTN|nr:siderophore-interacting protein [Streptomyces coryli]